MSVNSSGDRRKSRRNQRARIAEFFERHLGVRFPSSELHTWFGSSFRTRVSEINRDQSGSIRILNETKFGRSELGERCEHSVYWAERQEEDASRKVSWPATFGELEEAGYGYTGTSKECDCGARFLWFITPAGKWMGLSAIEGNRLVPHRARCKIASHFRAAPARHVARAAAEDSRPRQTSLF